MGDFHQIALYPHQKASLRAVNLQSATQAPQTLSPSQRNAGVPSMPCVIERGPCLGETKVMAKTNCEKQCYLRVVIVIEWGRT